MADSSMEPATPASATSIRVKARRRRNLKADLVIFISCHRSQATERGHAERRNGLAAVLHSEVEVVQALVGLGARHRVLRDQQGEAEAVRRRNQPVRAL